MVAFLLSLVVIIMFSAYYLSFIKKPVDTSDSH